MTTEREVLNHLESLAPLGLAAEWDNVGLIVGGKEEQRSVENILLTIDLTPAVLQEAIASGTDARVALAE